MYPEFHRSSTSPHWHSAGQMSLPAGQAGLLRPAALSMHLPERPRLQELAASSRAGSPLLALIFLPGELPLCFSLSSSPSPPTPRCPVGVPSSRKLSSAARTGPGPPLSAFLLHVALILPKCLVPAPPRPELQARLLSLRDKRVGPRVSSHSFQAWPLGSRELRPLHRGRVQEGGLLAPLGPFAAWAEAAVTQASPRQWLSEEHPGTCFQVPCLTEKLKTSASLSRLKMYPQVTTRLLYWSVLPEDEFPDCRTLGTWWTEGVSGDTLVPLCGKQPTGPSWERPAPGPRLQGCGQVPRPDLCLSRGLTGLASEGPGGSGAGSWGPGASSRMGS